MGRALVAAWRRVALWAGVWPAGLCLCAAAAPALAQEFPAGVDPDRGVFLLYCAACHGADGAGDGPRAARLPRRPADLTRLAEVRGSVLPRGRLVGIVDPRRPRRRPDCDELIFLGAPSFRGREAAARGTVLQIADFLDTLWLAE